MMWFNRKKEPEKEPEKDWKANIKTEVSSRYFTKREGNKYVRIKRTIITTSTPDSYYIRHDYTDEEVPFDFESDLKLVPDWTYAENSF